MMSSFNWGDSPLLFCEWQRYGLCLMALLVILFRKDNNNDDIVFVTTIILKLLVVYESIGAIDNKVGLYEFLLYWYDGNNNDSDIVGFRWIYGCLIWNGRYLIGNWYFFYFVDNNNNEDNNNNNNNNNNRK